MSSIQALKRIGFAFIGIMFVCLYGFGPNVAEAAGGPGYWCNFTVNGRKACNGYLTGTNFFDSSHDQVNENQIIVNPSNPNSNAIPMSVDSAPTFISFYENYLNRGSPSSYDFDSFGAAITIDIMLGANGPQVCQAYNGKNTCTWQAAIAYAQDATHLADWESRVNYYAQQGWINWNATLYEPTNYPDSGHACTNYKGCWPGKTPSYPPDNPSVDAQDVAWSGNNIPGVQNVIEFKNSSSLFILDRLCSNEVGDIAGIQPATPPTVSCDSFTSTDAAPDPNQPFKLKASVQYTPASATSTQFGPDSMSVSLSGPSPYHTISNTTSNPAISSGVASISLNVPPTHVSGTFTLTWAVAGPLAPAKTCTDTINIAYQPYFDVVGGDVSAGQGFETSSGGGCTDNPAADINGVNLDTSSSPGNYFGASTRQAAIATGNIMSFATDETNDYTHNLGGSTDGISTHPPNALAESNVSPISPVYGGKALGTYAGNWCVPNYVTSYTATAASAFHQLTALPSSWSSLVPNTSYFIQLNSNQTIDSGSPGAPITIPSGTHVTIVDTSGSVFIKSDIKYSGYTNQPTLGQTLTNIPQLNLLVSGGNIFIDPSVDQLNGFYDAQPNGSGTGEVLTCANGDTSIAANAIKDYSQCSVNPLTIYGAVSADEIIFGRTGGNVEKSGPVKDTPAEQIVYTPELWLGAFAAPNSSCATDPTQNQCMYQSYTSLPPVL